MSSVTLEEAYSKWADDLGRYATALVGPSAAVDIVSDAVVTVLASGKWDEVHNPKAYLTRAVLNAARQRSRSGMRRRARETRFALEEPQPVLELGDSSQLRLDTLSTRQRSVIHLTYWDDLAPAAIAELLGISEGTVRRHLARARAKLRKALTNDDR